MNNQIKNNIFHPGGGDEIYFKVLLSIEAYK